MALVNQVAFGTRSYTPFEGMSEQQRLWNSVPRGMVRFANQDALTAKPINDDYNLQITCALPLGFAYVFSSMSFSIQSDVATDFNAVAKVRVFNGLAHVAPDNTQSAVVDMSNYNDGGTLDPFRVANFSLGSIREWFPNPIWAPPGAAGMNFILNYDNGADPAGAAGIIEFFCSLYQYELNQAVRFPLNNPIPVGIR